LIEVVVLLLAHDHVHPDEAVMSELKGPTPRARTRARRDALREAQDNPGATKKLEGGECEEDVGIVGDVVGLGGDGGSGGSACPGMRRPVRCEAGDDSLENYSYLWWGLERVLGLPPSFPFSLAAFAFAFDLANPPSFPSWRAISLTFIVAA
jgi:hypothetical protein